MFLAVTFVNVLLAGLLAYAAVRKLSHDESVVASYARVGVPEERLNLLAVILLLGATGLLLGLLFEPLGVAAASSLIGYFLVAIAAHIRTRDLANLATPLICLALAITSLSLRIATMS